MNVVAYIRVSGRGQVDGDGPDRQNDAITAFAKTHALTVEGSFSEMAVSGTVEAVDRPEFAALLAYAEDHKSVEAIVVERLDRLARDLMVSELLLSECRKRNLKVYAADQGMLIDMASNGGDPTRILVRQIMGAIAQWDKSMLVKRMSLARARITNTGAKCEGRKEFGFYPKEQPVLTAMKLLVETPGLTWRGIARQLTDAGLLTRSGGKWDSATVRRIAVRLGLRKGDTVKN